jgi:hypothetical protein
MRKRLPPAWEGDNRIRRVTWKRPYRQPSPREPGPSLGEVVAGIGALWRRKRAYERGQSA